MLNSAIGYAILVMGEFNFFLAQEEIVAVLGRAEFAKYQHDANTLRHASINYVMRSLPEDMQTKTVDLRYAILLHMIDNNNNMQRFALSCANISFFPIIHGLSFQAVPACMQADAINEALCFHDEKLLSSTTATRLYLVSKKSPIILATT